ASPPSVRSASSRHPAETRDGVRAATSHGHRARRLWPLERATHAHTARRSRPSGVQMDLVAHLDGGYGRMQHGRSTGANAVDPGALVSDVPDVDVRAEIELLFTRHHGEIYGYLARMVRE